MYLLLIFACNLDVKYEPSYASWKRSINPLPSSTPKEEDDSSKYTPLLLPPGPLGLAVNTGSCYYKDSSGRETFHSFVNVFYSLNQE